MTTSPLRSSEPAPKRSSSNADGRCAAVLLSVERYSQLMDALGEIEDAAAFDAALAEEGPNVPWDQVAADLGLA